MRAINFLFIALACNMAGAPLAAEAADICKNDPRVVEACRWTRGVVGASVRGVMHLSVSGEELWVLPDEDTLNIVLDLPGLYSAGEFEFCRFKDRTVNIVVDADGTTAPIPQRWGCVNAVRNTLSEPDFETQCEYARSENCKNPKPTP